MQFAQANLTNPRLKKLQEISQLPRLRRSHLFEGNAYAWRFQSFPPRHGPPDDGSNRGVVVKFIDYHINALSNPVTSGCVDKTSPRGSVRGKSLLCFMRREAGRFTYKNIKGYMTPGTNTNPARHKPLDFALKKITDDFGTAQFPPGIQSHYAFGILVPAKAQHGKTISQFLDVPFLFHARLDDRGDIQQNTA